MSRFGPVITAMVTPFDADGRVDLEGAAALGEWLVAQGNDALVLTGSTGEASMLSDDEQVEVWRASVSVPLIAGSGTNDTAHAAELTAMAGKAGMDGVLLVTPYYNRPPQSGIEAHFRTVAAATELPVLLYDIPIRSSRKISHEVLVRLAEEVPNIVGLKDAAGNPAETARTVADTPEDFFVYAGDDSMTLRWASSAWRAIGPRPRWRPWSTPSSGATTPRRPRSTPPCSSPTTSSPVTSPPTRSRPRPCCAPSANRPVSVGSPWGLPPTGSKSGRSRC
jgi:4-hydroxy-tetrahydrodipicolinate synthase